MALLKLAFVEDGSWDINPKFPFIQSKLNGTHILSVDAEAELPA